MPSQPETTSTQQQNTEPTNNRKIPKWLLIAILIGVGVIAFTVLPFLSWMLADEGLNRTADIDFCMSCHSMEQFQPSYEADIHGGKNSYGIQVNCTNCHLDHSSSTAYFISKAQKGMHDLYVETFHDTEAIDWEAKRDHRESYTYDSGCLSCHNNLQRATMGNNKAFIAHYDYFAGTSNDQCVTCHKHVGHKNMGLTITP